MILRSGMLRLVRCARAGAERLAGAVGSGRDPGPEASFAREFSSACARTSAASSYRRAGSVTCSFCSLLRYTFDGRPAPGPVRPPRRCGSPPAVRPRRACPGGTPRSREWNPWLPLLHRGSRDRPDATHTDTATGAPDRPRPRCQRSGVASGSDHDEILSRVSASERLDKSRQLV